MAEDVDSRITIIFKTIKEIKEDTSTPKNVKLKLEHITTILGSVEDHSIKVSRAMHEIEDVVDDNNNMQPYTRTQLWNLVSMLEGSLY